VLFRDSVTTVDELEMWRGQIADSGSDSHGATEQGKERETVLTRLSEPPAFRAVLPPG